MFYYLGSSCSSSTPDTVNLYQYVYNLCYYSIIMGYNYKSFDGIEQAIEDYIDSSKHRVRK